MNKVSFILMLITTMIGLFDLSIISSRAIAYKSNSVILNSSSVRLPYLREKDEVGSHYISYSESQRVASRASGV